MKKSLLALAVAAFVSTSASAAQVYDKDGTTLDIGGEVETMYWSNHASDMASEDQTVSDRVRLNLTGRTQFTNNIAGYGFYEWETEHKGDSTEATDVNARYAYVGVDFGKFGQLQVGRYEDPFEYAGNVVDNLEEAGLICGMDERNSGHLSYMWSGFGFDAGISYQFAEDKYNADMFGTVDVDSGFSVYAGYTTPSVGFGPITIRAAYLYLNAQQEKTHYDDDGNLLGNFLDDDEYNTDADFIKNIKSSDFGLAWGNMGDGWYLATHYNYSKASGYTEGEEGDFFLKFKIWESMVSYGFDNGVVLSAAYSHINITDKDNEGTEKKAQSKTAQLIASYDINENFRVWGEAIFDCDSDDDASQFYKKVKGYDDGEPIYEGANAFLVGARYTF